MVREWSNIIYPDSRFGEVRPHRNLLPDAHVRISVPGEEGLELLQLLRREVRPLSSLPFLVLSVFRVVELAVGVVGTLTVSFVVTWIWKIKLTFVKVREKWKVFKGLPANLAIKTTFYENQGYDLKSIKTFFYHFWTKVFSDFIILNF